MFSGIIIYFFLFSGYTCFGCIYVSLPQINLVTLGARRYPESGDKDAGEFLWGCLEPHSDPPQEKQMLITEAIYFTPP